MTAGISRWALAPVLTRRCRLTAGGFDDGFLLTGASAHRLSYLNEPGLAPIGSFGCEQLGLKSG